MEIDTGSRKIPDAGSFRERTSYFILSMNEYIKEICRDHLVPCIDLYREFSSPEQNDLLDPRFAIGDNAHLNLEGQIKMARCFYEGYLRDSKDADVIVCLGDSHTQGFPIRDSSRNGVPIDTALDSEHQFPYWLKKWSDGIVINRGMAGNTLYGMTTRFDVEVLVHLPDHCIIQGGTNDSLIGTPLEESKKDIKELIERCLSAEIVPIVGTIVPLGF